MVSRIGDILPKRVPTVVPPTVTKLKLLPLKAHITLPPKLGRPPTTADLIIKRTFDGLTPAAAAKEITRHFKGTIAPQNKTLVSTTVDARVRDMQVALNNVFTTFLGGLTFASLVIGHATFCVVVVLNNAAARLRRTLGNVEEAAMDLGATRMQTFRDITFPAIAAQWSQCSDLQRCDVYLRWLG